VNLFDLKDKYFLLSTTTYGYGISDHVIELCNKTGFSPKIRYWGTEILPILLMVKKGIGVTLVPEYFCSLENVWSASYGYY
jgi:LysR family transcriptional regulator, salicylic acid-responsive activator of bsdBCD